MKLRTIALISIILSLSICLVSFYHFEKAFTPENDDANFLSNEDQFDQNLAKDDKIVIGIYNAGYLYHENHDHGINKEIIEELFNRLGMDYRIVIMPRARVSTMLAEGKISISVSTINTPERAKYSYFVPYFVEHNHVLIKSDVNISTEEELLEAESIRFGIVRGYYYGEHYTELIEKLREKNMIVEAKDTEHLYTMLRDNWIQVTLNNLTSYMFYLDYYKIKDVNIYDWASEEEPLIRNLAFSKEHFTEEDVLLFQETIEKMRDDGTIFSIFNRYLSTDDTERACDF